MVRRNSVKKICVVLCSNICMCNICTVTFNCYKRVVSRFLFSDTFALDHPNAVWGLTWSQWGVLETQIARTAYFVIYSLVLCITCSLAVQPQPRLTVVSNVSSSGRSMLRPDLLH